MFRELFSFLVKKKNLSFFDKNRERFIETHTDKRFYNIENIYERLRVNDNTLTDDEIINAYYKYSNSLQTNTISMAEIEFVTIATICYFKPDMVSELLFKGIHSLVMTLDDNIVVEDVFDFIDNRIIDINAKPYGGIPDEYGMKWLTIDIKSQNKIIQETIEKVIIMNNQLLNQK